VSESADWSPDEASETETYEPWDEALDEQDELAPDGTGNPEGERSLDRQLTVDDAELDELGARLDDPEQLALLDGGIDDPDGGGAEARRGRQDDGGWDLDQAEERRQLDSLDDDTDVGG
jgi:hypothetical protein